jgi:hypothetical protein
LPRSEFAAGFAREDAPKARRAKLDALLAQSGATAEETTLIAALLSLPHDLPEIMRPVRDGACRRWIRFDSIGFGSVRRRAWHGGGSGRSGSGRSGSG